MEKLYEHDPYLREFSATVVACTPCEKGFEVLLDRTAFFPLGGGQPWDIGTLSACRVVEVYEREGAVIHLCEQPLTPGSVVTGEIDWARRFDLMQHHSGEHIVSGLAHAMYGCENVGFHMGSECITIDLSLPLTPEQLSALEQAANEYIWQNHPISITVPSPAELAQMSFRQKKALDWPVRIVSFPGGDACACCGTHVSTSAQVGLIKFLSWQPLRGGIRIELLCGGRAMRYLCQVWTQGRHVSALLSANLMEIGAATQRGLEDFSALQSRLFALEGRYIDLLAQTQAGKENVLLFAQGLSPDGLRRLANALLARCRGRCACFSGTDEDGYQYVLGWQEGNLAELGRAMNQSLSGRGGGKGLWQGAVKATQVQIQTWWQENTAQ